MLDNVAIHLFKTPMNHYLYDLNTNLFVKVSSVLFDYLNDSAALSDDVQMEIARLHESGILKNYPVKYIQHPESRILRYKLDRHLNNLVLQITQQCNLRCRYCVFSGSYTGRIHSEKSMSMEIARKAIDFFLERTIDANKVSIAFFGGEPLLRFDLVKELVGYAERKTSKEIIFVITTNGTLLNEQMIEFFIKHNLLLTISFDGDKRIHDKNRVFADGKSGTFDIITSKIEKLRHKYPDYFSEVRFNVVMDQKESFSCTNKFFLDYDAAKNGIVSSTLINDNYSTGDILESESFIKDYNYEKFKCFLSEIGSIEKKYMSLLVEPKIISVKEKMKNRIHFSLAEMNHHSGTCIPGVQKLFVTVDGKFYPCERVNEESYVMNIGNIHEGFDENKILDLMNFGKLTEEECKTCWAFRFCELCPISADKDSELSRSMKLKKCEEMKIKLETNIKEYLLLKDFNCI